jgi:hypothetical protein
MLSAIHSMGAARRATPSRSQTAIAVFLTIQLIGAVVGGMSMEIKVFFSIRGVACGI